jgi:hypothetical protein
VELQAVQQASYRNNSGYLTNIITRFWMRAIHSGKMEPADLKALAVWLPDVDISNGTDGLVIGSDPIAYMIARLLRWLFSGDDGKSIDTYALEEMLAFVVNQDDEKYKLSLYKTGSAKYSLHDATAPNQLRANRLLSTISSNLTALKLGLAFISNFGTPAHSRLLFNDAMPIGLEYRARPQREVNWRVRRSLRLSAPRVVADAAVTNRPFRSRQSEFYCLKYRVSPVCGVGAWSSRAPRHPAYRRNYRSK